MKFADVHLLLSDPHPPLSCAGGVGFPFDPFVCFAAELLVVLVPPIKFACAHLPLSDPHPSFACVDGVGCPFDPLPCFAPLSSQSKPTPFPANLEPDCCCCCGGGDDEGGGVVGRFTYENPGGGGACGFPVATGYCCRRGIFPNPGGGITVFFCVGGAGGGAGDAQLSGTCCEESVVFRSPALDHAVEALFVLDCVFDFFCFSQKGVSTKGAPQPELPEEGGGRRIVDGGCGRCRADACFVVGVDFGGGSAVVVRFFEKVVNFGFCALRCPFLLLSLERLPRVLLLLLLDFGNGPPFIRCFKMCSSSIGL